jgi:hypothetical protein
VAIVGHCYITVPIVDVDRPFHLADISLKRISAALIKPTNLIAIEALIADLHRRGECPNGRKTLDCKADGFGAVRNDDSQAAGAGRPCASARCGYPIRRRRVIPEGIDPLKSAIRPFGLDRPFVAVVEDDIKDRLFCRQRTGSQSCSRPATARPFWGKAIRVGARGAILLKPPAGSEPAGRTN